MREDFCALILTHKRPNRVYTYKTLRRAGYTGPIYLVLDDQDPSVDAYREIYGDQVQVFSKVEAKAKSDRFDNQANDGSVLYARNMAHEIAQGLGFKYFMQLDDDYSSFFYRLNGRMEYNTIRIRHLDRFLEVFIEYYETIPALSIAMAQGGDLIGGGNSTALKANKTLRKAMNSFLCSVDRPFQFLGRFNDDVTTYVMHGFRGELFLTILAAQLCQKTTQANPGGLTELYLDAGTFVKSFYTVMACPSAVYVKDMGHTSRRIHHAIRWEHTVPKILRETHRRV